MKTSRVAVLKDIKGGVGRTDDERTLRNKLNFCPTKIVNNDVSDLDSLVPQLSAISKLRGMYADTIVELAVGDSWKMGFLGAKTCCLNKMLAGNTLTPSGGLNVNNPLLYRFIVSSGQNLCRIDAVELENVDVFANLVAQLFLGEKMWALKVFVVGCQEFRVSGLL